MISDQPEGPNFQVYSKSSCPWCDAAKELLTRMGRPFSVVDLDNPATRSGFLHRHDFLPKLTVPQIWHGDEHIGGYQDLVKYLGVQPE